MVDQLVASIEPWLLFVGLFGLFLVAVEGGFRVGRRQEAGINDKARIEITTGEAAVLGLLALLLSFSFSMSGSRYEIQRGLVSEEANAIGTTYLRARLLPEPHRTEVAGLLREYVDVRLEFYAAGMDREKLQKAYDKTEQLHNRMWAEAVAAAEQDQRAVTTGLFVQSLNDVIDLHAKRVTALENRVPLPMFLMLVFVAATAMGLMGYASGTTVHRNLIMTTMVALLIATIIALIVDLHRPRQGLIRVSQQSMIDLRDSIDRNTGRLSP